MKGRGGETSFMNSSLDLSVIVVNWNVRDLLRDCLRSLYDEMLVPPDAWELIVVDNDSRDGSAEMVRKEFPEAVLMANDQNLGFGKANNQAFRICRGRYVLLLNPDTVVAGHAVDRMMGIIHERSDVAALGCRLLTSDGTVQRWTGGHSPRPLNVACHFLFPYRALPAGILARPLVLEKEPIYDVEVGWVSGACMLLRRAALGEKIFDERFFLYGEDLELCDQLVRNGWKVLYTPRVHILHYGASSLGKQTAEIQLTRLRNLREIFATHNANRSPFVFDLVVSIGFLARSIAYALAAGLRPGRGFETRSADCRLLCSESVRMLLRFLVPFRELWSRAR